MNNDKCIVEVRPIESMEIGINQIEKFFMDLVALEKEVGDDYWSDFNRLRDETDKLRSEYSILYSKILSDHPELEKLVD